MGSNTSSKNDTAWERLFARYHILDRIGYDGQFRITAELIREYREPRLMTKFDHQSNLPELFAKNNLTILPVSRGSYLISHFDVYAPVPPSTGRVARFSLPSHIESIDSEDITSEATALNCALASGILTDFAGEQLLTPTVSGRMKSDSFAFTIRNVASGSPATVDVENSQLEVDGGYEGERSLLLVEAKNSISDDFLVRQLYYPFRLWTGKISKRVVPIYFVYSNGVFHLYEYKFENPGDYNSLVLTKQKDYTIDTTDIDLRDIVDVLNRVGQVDEPELPFPQADSFPRVINLCELLSQGSMTKEDITSNYDFDPRQTNYYTDAARYLGLVDKHTEDGEIVFSLSDEGFRIMRSRYKARQLRFAGAILRHRVFAETLKTYLNWNEMPSKAAVVAIMRESNLFRVEADSTFRRRASTVVSWMDWIAGLARS